MATVVETHTICDIDGAEAKGEVTFQRDGIGYAIDLCEEHLTIYSDFLLEYADHGRRTGQPKAARKAGRADVVEVRTWGKENGFSVSDRGRIPAEVYEAYDNRTQKRNRKKAAAAE